MLQVVATSRVLVKARVRAEIGDPTAFPVRVQFVTSGHPLPDGWIAATWERFPDPITGGPAYRAQVLVGPGGDVVLPIGVYTMYVEVTATPEIPNLVAGQIQIT